MGNTCGGDSARKGGGRQEGCSGEEVLPQFRYHREGCSGDCGEATPPPVVRVPLVAHEITALVEGFSFYTGEAEGGVDVPQAMLQLTAAHDAGSGAAAVFLAEIVQDSSIMGTAGPWERGEAAGGFWAEKEAAEEEALRLYVDALRLGVKEEAARGEPYAQLATGLLHTGCQWRIPGLALHIPKDAQGGVELFTLASAQGLAHATFKLGLNEGKVEEKVARLKVAAKAGNVHAMHELGELYSKPGQLTNLNAAAPYRVAAANAGYSPALVAVGRLKEASALGHGGASYALGNALQFTSLDRATGMDRTREKRQADEVAAWGWYRLAARQGNACAMYELGHCVCHGYDNNGYTVAADRAEGVAWLRPLAILGKGVWCVKAREDLAELGEAPASYEGSRQTRWLQQLGLLPEEGD